jgi:hypothetical protein
MTNEEKKEESLPKIIITWRSTPKKTVFSVKEAVLLRKSPTGGDGYARGSGHLYFNPTTNRYEKPTSIDAYIPPRRRRSAL